MARFFISLLIFAAGFLVMKYAYELEQWVGRVESAEKYFGGTYNFLQAVGVMFVIVSVLYLFGILQAIVAPLGGFFGG